MPRGDGTGPTGTSTNMQCRGMGMARGRGGGGGLGLARRCGMRNSGIRSNGPERLTARLQELEQELEAVRQRLHEYDMIKEEQTGC